MNFNEFKERIKEVPFPESLKYRYAVLWLHPDHLPMAVVGLGEEEKGVIKVPKEVVNRYGRSVPVIRITPNGFAEHSEITDIVLPPSITEIDPGSFSGCTGLKRITIPKKVRRIGGNTFAGCRNLEDVYYEGTFEEWKKIKIVYEKYEAVFGDLIPGTSVQELKGERLIRIPGNEALFTANLHFRCELE